MRDVRAAKRRRLPLPAVPTFALDELLVHGRFGPLGPGVKRPEVLAALGQPDAHSHGMTVAQATIWVYGQLCRGHLELHFLDNDELWMIFSDYLPVRRHRTAAFRLDPGCLGGLGVPPLGAVLATLARCGVAAAVTPRDPRWSDPQPAEALRRIPVHEWNKVCRAVDPAAITDSFHSEVRLPTGVILGIGSELATLPGGERVAREDAVIVMSASMTL